MEGQNKVEQLIGNIKEYAETRFDMAVLNTQDKVTDLLSTIATIVLVGLLAIIIVVLSSVGLAWYVGQLLHNPSLGFFCVAGLYLLFAIILYINRNSWVKMPVINSLLKKININEED